VELGAKGSGTRIGGMDSGEKAIPTDSWRVFCCSMNSASTCRSSFIVLSDGSEIGMCQRSVDING